MTKTWVLICDASRARLFEASGRHFKMLKELNHPESRLKGKDLTSDRPGQVRSNALMHPAHAPDAPKQVEAGHFALQLAELLRKGHSQKAFDELVLAAPPHFLGMLRERMGTRINVHLRASVAKDLTAYDEADLRKWLAGQMPVPPGPKPRPGTHLAGR
jgi:protein required for attachment to host cells